MFTQISRCKWCDREKKLEFDEAPKEWVKVDTWYHVHTPIMYLGGEHEFCTLACMKAWVMSV